MHSYTAYGLTFQSEIPLPELIEAAPQNGAARSGSVMIEQRAIDRTLPPGVNPEARHWATPDAVFLDYEGVAAYRIDQGRRIIIEPAPQVDPRIVRLYLLGPILAVLLHQRGFLVLHSSGVNINGNVAAFLGDKGTGKSTMAAALHARGHALVADDVVAVDTTGTIPMAYPGFPQLKLFPESAAQLGGTDQLPRLHPDFDKRARRAESNFPQQALPLRAIFELINSDHEGVEPVAGPTAMMTLVRHSYLLPMMAATGTSALHFRQTVGLTQRVTVLRLHRRRILDELPKVAAIVEDAIANAR